MDRWIDKHDNYKYTYSILIFLMVIKMILSLIKIKNKKVDEIDIVFEILVITSLIIMAYHHYTNTFYLTAFIAVIIFIIVRLVVFFIIYKKYLKYN